MGQMDGALWGHCGFLNEEAIPLNNSQQLWGATRSFLDGRGGLGIWGNGNWLEGIVGG